MSNAARDAAYSENTRKALSLDAPAQGSSTLDAQDVSAGRAEGSSSVEEEVDAPEWEVPLAMLRDLYLPASALAGGTSIGATYPSPKTRSELENGSASRASSSPSSQKVSSAQDAKRSTPTPPMKRRAHGTLLLDRRASVELSRSHRSDGLRLREMTRTLRAWG
ncbi:hypothetical protein IE81DRAFT_146910 [Ceraceosorus guamensis]|uniref:Uncharacterized protein n=1 Tax=Ceraceosorus guamensis TaxID=1522189 RepID=A0A316VXN0_9BASI|nr:hypothetical protein IE81DRAFT_146910 [Ceraceosorus guamensis]PWN42074.1 hypothetical protein IE81DRAFT_146910 [Ceraceosorus guamensis]